MLKPNWKPKGEIHVLNKCEECGKGNTLYNYNNHTLRCEKCGHTQKLSTWKAEPVEKKIIHMVFSALLEDNK